MKMFKYELLTKIMYKGILHIIVGRSQFVNTSDRYMLQTLESYKKDNVNFLNTLWATEKEMKIHTNEKGTKK